MTHRQTQLLENIINGELTLLSCKRTVTREDGDINENNVKICLKTVPTHMENRQGDGVDNFGSNFNFHVKSTSQNGKSPAFPHLRKWGRED